MLLGNIHFIKRESVTEEKQFKLQEKDALCIRSVPEKLCRKYLYIESVSLLTFIIILEVCSYRKYLCLSISL